MHKHNLTKEKSRDRPFLRKISAENSSELHRILMVLDDIDRKDVIRTVNLKGQPPYCFARVKQQELLVLKLMIVSLKVEKPPR
jgi:hypothetical protein